LIIFIPCLIKLSKEIPALAEQRQVHYNLLTTFDTFGNALKLTKNRATSNIFDNSFSEQNPKIFY
jgi:ribosomal protein L7Ae-like RNA K-turn-binding protein